MTQIGDTAIGKSERNFADNEQKKMSEYYLADQRAHERAKKHGDESDVPSGLQSQEVKATLLGEFMLSSGESQGVDPYNTVHGKSPRDTWRNSRGRR